MAKALSRPLVSVVMPVHNAGGFLKPAIKSILNQTQGDFEFIIINDGSTDQSLKIIKEFAAKDTRVRFIDQTRMGLVQTLNKGIVSSKGHFIARQDADDISHPSRLEKQSEYLNGHPEVGLLGTNIEVVDGDGKPVSRAIANVDLLTNSDDLKLAEVFSNQFAHGSIMARASLIKAARYDPAYKHAEDYELWSRLSRTTKIANLKEPLYTWRLHEKGVTNAHSTDMASQAIRVAGREFDNYLKNRAAYKFFSFHPLSMRGGVKSYLKRKSSVYRDMGVMYCRHGLRRKALPAMAMAIIHTPWSLKNYHYLALVLASQPKAATLDYELF